MTSETLTVGTVPGKTPHPIVYMFLLIPYGATTGYLVVTLGYLLSNSGISPALIAGLIGLNVMPQTLKFLWSPLVDIMLSVKKWHVIATAASALCVLAMSTIPIKVSSLPVFAILVVISSVACSFVGIATNSLSAHNTHGNAKGRVSGYLQAGNLGGQGVGGGLGLYLSGHMAHALAAVIIGLLFMACCIGLFYVSEPVETVKDHSFAKSMANLGKDVWWTIKKQRGIIALVLCLMPIGTCAASNLFSAIANEWHASANVVAVITGLLGGLITAIGCLFGGWICDKMDRKIAYVLVGIVQAITALGMALCPHTNMMYIVWTSLYTFASGLCYSAFNAFTLEVIGKGAAGTKFELFASISNVPILLMTFVAGWAYAAWGAKGMFETEAVFAAIGIAGYFIIKTLIEIKKVKPVEEPELVQE